jgi:hypothetical protein
VASSLPPAVPQEQPAIAGSQQIRLLIGDETPMGCQLLSTLPRSRFRFEVVACATSCSEILDCMRAHSVDVALVSESLQGGPFAGFPALNELQAA